ncbi:uncharacterized protein CBL_09133 [Carabus blaptoides fortunei]
MTSNSTNALNLLAAYGTDSDSEDEIPGPRVSVKRTFRDNSDSSEKRLKQSEGYKLPVPAIFQTKSDSSDQIEHHGGRIRTFPHERGNWSTYVYISYEHDDIMSELINDIISNYKSSFLLQPCDNLHISLTRTVILRHHWIESFMKTISDNISHLSRFVIMFDGLKVYCNDERTRTFIGLKIKTGYDSLLNIVQILDECLKQYNLPEFYKDPSFHMSLAWCVGDYENVLNNNIDLLNEIVSEYMKNYPQLYWYIHVKNLVCKTGNKMFNFNLTSNIS